MSYQRMSSKTRRYCAAGGCQADKRRKIRIYLSGGWYFQHRCHWVEPFVSSYPLPCNLPRHRLELSPGSAPRQVHIISRNLAYDLNYKKPHPVRAGTVWVLVLWENRMVYILPLEWRCKIPEVYKVPRLWRRVYYSEKNDVPAVTRKSAIGSGEDFVIF